MLSHLLFTLQQQLTHSSALRNLQNRTSSQIQSAFQSVQSILMILLPTLNRHLIRLNKSSLHIMHKKMNRVLMRLIFLFCVSANSRQSLTNQHIYFSLSAERSNKRYAVTVCYFADYCGIFAVFALFH